MAEEGESSVVQQPQEEVPSASAAPAESQGGGTPEDLIAWFNSTIQDYDATFIAYFKEFNELYEELQGKKVGIFGVCAEPQSEVDKAMKEWGLKFTCFSDVTHVLRNYLAEKGLINIRVSGGENSTDSGFYKVHPKIKHYKYGVAQPGVLCVKPDATVVYAWAIDPSVMNVGGASDRPVPSDIWTFVQTKMWGDGGDSTIINPPIRRRGACSLCTIL